MTPPETSLHAAFYRIDMNSLVRIAYNLRLNDSVPVRYALSLYVSDKTNEPFSKKAESKSNICNFD